MEGRVRTLYAERDVPPQPLAGTRGWMLLLPAFVVAGVLRLFGPGRLLVGWVGFVIAVIGAVYFVHPARVTWDGSQWVRQPGTDRLLSQRLLAGVAFLIGVGAIFVAIINFGTFSG